MTPAVFELTTRMKAISRADGRSATSAAAYRACCVVECEREGKIHDYTGKRGHLASGIVLPPGSPRWARDRASLWNAAEMRERNKDKRAKSEFKANAQTARETMFSLPHQLSPEGMQIIAEIVARYLVEKHGVAVDYSLHKPGKKGDWRNFHCHLMSSTRRLTAKGFGEKARECDDLKNAYKLAKEMRKFIADTINAQLKAEGKAEVVFVEYRSFRARGSAQVPTRHVGPREHMERKHRNKATKAWGKAHSQYQKERHAKDLASLQLRQDFALQGKLASLAQRGRDGEAAIRAKFAEQRRADPDSTGMRRLFQIVTGREGRAAFDRLAREDRRTAAENAQVQGLKREVQAERNAYVTGQTKDRAAMIERHGIEDRQLTQAVISREFADKAAERSGRQRPPKERTISNENEQVQGRGRGPEFTPT